MPIYEYKCESGHTFEESQSIKDDPLKVCPIIILYSSPSVERCGAAVKKLISKTSFVLKGEGWFKDGY